MWVALKCIPRDEQTLSHFRWADGQMNPSLDSAVTVRSARGWIIGVLQWTALEWFSSQGRVVRAHVRPCLLCSSLWARLHLVKRTAQRLEVLLITCQPKMRCESPSRHLHMEHRCRKVRSRGWGGRTPGGLSFGFSASVIKLSHVKGRWIHCPVCVCVCTYVSRHLQVQIDATHTHAAWCPALYSASSRMCAVCVSGQLTHICHP